MLPRDPYLHGALISDLDATPKKRIPPSHLVKDLLRRMDTLERRSVGSATESSQSRTPELSPSELNLHSSYSTPPISNSGLGLATRREVLTAFFSHVHGNPYVFLDEETTRSHVMNCQVSDGFLHALIAVSIWYVPDIEDANKSSRSEHHLQISERSTDSCDMSLNSVQALIMQVLCLLSLGRGSAAWMKIGAAIRMAQGIELQKQAATENGSSLKRLSSAHRCVLTLYMMDRFSVCGSNRPMIINDDWFDEPRQSSSQTDRYRLENPAGQAFQKQDQGEIIQGLFADIVKLLGQSTHYLQKGGVQGDSHFPWHQHSILSTLIGDLTKWKDRTDSTISFHSLDYSNSVNVNRLCLSWFLYHAVLIRLYRQFLPLIMADRGSDYASDPWQQETSRKCVEHAITMAKLCDEATAHGYSWPFFTSFCLASAATVLIHAKYYDFATDSVFHLVAIVERLISMRSYNPLVEHQLEMLRRMYKCHSEMIREYCSGTLVTTNMHLTQFYKRYPEGEFDPSHVPFSQLGNWMDASLDGPDDLFALGSLPEKLGNLRGSPYTFQGPIEPVSQTFGALPMGERRLGSHEIISTMDSLDGYFEPDGGVYSPATMTENPSSQGCEPMDEELLKSLLEHMEGDYTGIEF
ncbi:hypothetical protein NM208_g1564 [Fusarium decemcellulare]|uniref:Uncharacterized protein n=1 Tax=Fusarium decemcellulare TaxID=57161 RepID=A0ACC1SVH8_9HYPO|nr:hypothetical protein NM208_g1564 [Fusarium decemcellulare]